MEEPEVPTEHLHEHMQEHVEKHSQAEAHGHGNRTSWIMGAALSSALLAAFAAVASLMAGHHVNEAMIEQIRASDEWNYYQAKGVKAAVLGSKLELLEGMDKAPSEKDKEKLSKYSDDQKEISDKAKEYEKSADIHLRTHVIFARGVTLFQVAIAVTAISVLTHKRRFWYVGMGFGVVGLVFLIQGFLLR
jgi:hypothetical protein